MAGASLSILKLDEDLKKYLIAEANTPSFKLSGNEADSEYAEVKPADIQDDEVSFTVETKESNAIIEDNQLSLQNVIYIVDKMSEVIIENEIPFCELDAHAGDGDFGMSVAKGFKQLKREWKEIIEASDTIGSFLEACSLVIMEYCGGASGPIWGSAFRAAGKSAGQRKTMGASDFADMMQEAVRGIQATGERSFGRGAIVGDKTLMDALIPCADTWSEGAKKGTVIKELFIQGAKEAVQGAKETEQIVARMGRAGAVGERSLGYPDAGAHGLGVIFTAIAESIVQ